MELYEAMSRRRTVRDFTDKEVPEAVLKRILASAFNAPTNDHLRQFHFVVVRGRENIMKVIAPVAKNTAAFQQTAIDSVRDVMDEDEYAMFTDALPKQQEMLVRSGCLVLPFFHQQGCPLCQPREQCSLNYFASAWCAIENIFLAATAEGLGCALRIPIGDEPEHVRKLVGAPEGYEFACFLAVGYPAGLTPAFRQKQIAVDDRIHFSRW